MNKYLIQSGDLVWGNRGFEKTPQTPISFNFFPYNYAYAVSLINPNTVVVKIDENNNKEVLRVNG